MSRETHVRAARRSWRRALAGAFLFAVALFPLAASGRAEAQGTASRTAATPQAPSASVAAPAAGAAGASASLPLSRVVLFTSGVGYFERDGEVSGNRVVTLRFPTQDINDLLKSLTVRDLDGGRVLGVDYASRDPLTRTLRSFAIDLTDNPGLSAILLQLRGEPVRLAAPDVVTGTIVSVETRTVASADTQKDETFVNLLTDKGIQSINLSTISSFEVLNPAIQAELVKGLALIADSRNADKKSVDIDFAGNGTRRVRVGYILETPVWKTAYRLVVGSGDSSYLQGWAIVENTSDEDWQGVKLDLVSGEPISFIMDLYQPVYTQRPTVKVPLPPSLMPQVYGEAMESAPSGVGAAPESAPSAASRAFAPPAPAAAPQFEQKSAGLGAAQPSAESFDLSQGVSAGASGAEVGELFQYSIEGRVSIPRQQSAMLPIVGRDITTKSVSIFNEQVLDKHPLLGLRLVNTTGLHLMGGPLTIFDGGVYAGDAEVGDIAPGGERLISYAVDLDTEVSTQGQSLPESITSVKINKGTMIVTRLLRREHDYTIVNRGAHARDVLVEYPIDGGWELVSPPSASETTRDLYRFSIDVAASSGGSGTGASPGRASLAVVEQQQVSQTVVLTNLSADTAAFYIRQQSVSQAVKDALAKLVQLRSELSDLTRQRQALEGQVREIRADQDRIRSNMSALDRNSNLYKRYVATLNDQEDTLTRLAEQIDALQSQGLAKSKQIDDFITSLNIE